MSTTTATGIGPFVRAMVHELVGSEQLICGGSGSDLDYQDLHLTSQWLYAVPLARRNSAPGTRQICKSILNQQFCYVCENEANNIVMLSGN